MSAVISPCGMYRYRLSRGTWPFLPFVMLNPSTADATQDDPTIRRCVSFAAREGRGIIVLNAYALRATDPAALKRAADPLGPDNDSHLNSVAHNYNRIVVAWGASIDPKREFEVQGILRRYGAQLVCLGKTKLGAPRHPLYVRGDQPLENWP